MNQVDQKGAEQVLRMMATSTFCDEYGSNKENVKNIGWDENTVTVDLDNGQKYIFTVELL